MKLTAEQIEIIRKTTGFCPLTDEQATESRLSDHFGDNTFYMDDNGVYVFEEVGIDGEALEGRQPVTAVMIASLESTGNDDEVQVSSIEPVLTTTTVDIG